RRSKEAYSTYYLDFPDAVTAHPFNEFSDLGIYDRCITRGLLASILPTAYNMGNQIIQVPGAVIIRNEMIHETRVIPAATGTAPRSSSRRRTSTARWASRATATRCRRART